MAHLRIASYNCRGLPKSKTDLLLRPDICDLLSCNDIVCMQETWFSKQDLVSLNCMHDEFNGVGVSTTDFNERLVAGHPPGGLAIMWRKEIDMSVSNVELGFDWCHAIELSSDDKKCLIINLYMPYQCHENEDCFLYRLGVLRALIEEVDSTCFVLLGDWNANISSNSSAFSNHLLKFCSDNHLQLSSKLLLPADTHTYISESWQTYSWLDHVVSSMDFHNSVSEMAVCYDITDVDHVPVRMCVNVAHIPRLSASVNDTSTKLNWSTLSEQALREYRRLTDVFLRQIVIDEKLLCADANCSDSDHKNLIDKLYGDIVKCLVDSSEVITAKKKNSHYNKPGWSNYVSDLYNSSKYVHQLWVNAGKPRQGDIFNLYKSSRARCKYAIRFVKKNENILRKEAMAAKLAQHDYKSFWKEVKCISRSKTPLPNNINGVCGEVNIAEIWKNHYIELFNCVGGNNNSANQSVNCSSGDIAVEQSEVYSAINDLASNKSCGLDCVYAEHLKYASSYLYHLLKICFTACFIHGYLPDKMMSVVLVPVIKNKSGSITSIDNYRPIAVTSVISKVVERILLNRMHDYIETQPNQFGFKNKLGTDICLQRNCQCLLSNEQYNIFMFSGC